MDKKTELAPQLGVKAQAYLEAYKLSVKYAQEVYSLFDKALGEWDGVYTTPEMGRPSDRELAQVVFDRELSPLQGYLKSVVFEEIDGDIYSEMMK